MAEEINITDWLKKAKEDPKNLAPPVVIVLALLFLGHKFLYAPKTIELKKVDRNLKRIEREINGIESAVESIEDIKLDIAEKKAQLNKILKLCYKKSEMTSFLRKVRELARQAGVPVKSLNPKPIIPIKIGSIDAELFSVSFNFSGDIVQLGVFLRLLEKEEKITFNKMPNLKPNASGTFVLELTPTSILLPDNLSIKTNIEEKYENNY